MNAAISATPLRRKRSLKTKGLLPRKGGPAITRSDLLIINKADLAPYVMADLDVMERDARIQRGTRPFLFCDLKREHNLDAVIAWLEREVLFARQPAGAPR